MTPELAGKIHDLVKDGALVLGPKPSRSPSLQDYPKCDEDVHTIAEEVWGDCDGKSVTEHAFGKGKVVYGNRSLGRRSRAPLKPDFEYPATVARSSSTSIASPAMTTIYFVSNQQNAFCAGQLHLPRDRKDAAASGTRTPA